MCGGEQERKRGSGGKGEGMGEERQELTGVQCTCRGGKWGGGGERYMYIGVSQCVRQRQMREDLEELHDCTCSIHDYVIR